MKTHDLAALATVALEVIKEIEAAIEEDAPGSPQQKPTTMLPTESFQLSLQKARQTCLTWTPELKSIQAVDLLTVADFFLIIVSRMIAWQAINQQIFQREEKLLNLVNDILGCSTTHPNLALVQLKSNYYRALIYITQQEDQINAIISHLKTVLMFQTGQLVERCRQIQMLDTLSIGCTSLINQPDLKSEDQDKIFEMGTQIMHRTMDLYDSVPASYDSSGWDRKLVYGNLVLHTLGLASRHFVEFSQAPERVKRYQVRMEPLLVRLQSFLGRHQRLSPTESECQLILELLINFLKALKPENAWLLRRLTKIARDFAPEVTSPQLLAHRVAIAAFEKLDEDNLELMKGVDEKLSIQKPTSLAPSEIIEKNSVKKYSPDEKISKIKTAHLAALAPQVLTIIEEKIDTVTESKAGSQKTLQKQSLVEPVEQKYPIWEQAQAARKVCESWLEQFSLCSMEDMLVVINFLLKKVAYCIAEGISLDIFQQEKQLLNLVDQILAENNQHSDLTFVQFHSRYYRALCYMTQQRDHIDDIVAHGNATLAFHCDKVTDRCKQILALDSLCVNGLIWIDDLPLKVDESDKMLEFVSDVVQTIADIYESIPTLESASALLPGLSAVEMHSNLVARTVTIVQHYFENLLYTPETADLYHHRIEKLLTRLQVAICKHRYPPQEKECLKVLSMVISILQKFDKQKQNAPWQVQLIQIAEKFVPNTLGSQVLAYQIMITSFKKSSLKVKKNPSAPPVESKFVNQPTPPKRYSTSLPKTADKKEDNRVVEENKKLRRQLQEAQKKVTKQRKAFIKKNKSLTKRLENQEKEKIAGEQLLTAKERELKKLMDESKQLETQLTQAQHRKALLTQQQMKLSEEKRSALEEQKQQEVLQREQEANWGQQIREQTTTVDSVKEQSRQFKIQVADNQREAEALEVELKQTQIQLDDANKQMSRQAMDRKCDETAKCRKIESLQNEIQRLQALLPEPTGVVLQKSKSLFS